MEQLSVDEILADFRGNGKDVAYVDYLNDIEIDRYCSEGQSLIRGLLDANALDVEMKIIRPPSRTPSHLPTSKDSILKKYHQQLAHLQSSVKPSGCPRADTNTVFQGMSSVIVQGWNFNISSATPLYRAPYVVDLTSAMTQMTVSNQVLTPGSLRPIFGNGSSRQQASFVRLASEKRSPSLSNACLQPYLAGIQLTTPPQDSQKRVVLPKVRPNSCEKLVKESFVDMDASSEDELSVSVDSGHCTGGDLSSSGSEVSPKSVCGESLSPSYASILHTPPSSRSSFKAHSRLQRKLRNSNGCSSDRSSDSGRSSDGRRSERRNSDVRSSDGRRSDSPKECVFCKTNGETPSMYRGHVLKDEQGKTVCHVLKKYVCPICGATGSRAHTVKYCPANHNPPAVSMMTTLKAMRSATGDVRDSRRCSRSGSGSRALAKRNPKRTATGASSYGGAAYSRNDIST